MSQLIGIVPARAGSERVKNKNLRELAGRPLIEWTIEAALISTRFERLLVSTDSHEIAEVAVAAGAEVPFLRTRYSDALSGVTDATIDFARRLDLEVGATSIAQLLPVCPFRNAQDIVMVMDSFLSDPERRSIISGSQFVFQPPWWACTLGKDGAPKYLFPNALKQRSQDLEEALAPNGAIWVSTLPNLLSHGSFYSESHRMIELPWKSGLDIDTETDFQIAQALV